MSSKSPPYLSGSVSNHTPEMSLPISLDPQSTFHPDIHSTSSLSVYLSPKYYHDPPLVVLATNRPTDRGNRSFKPGGAVVRSGDSQQAVEEKRGGTRLPTSNI